MDDYDARSEARNSWRQQCIREDHVCEAVNTILEELDGRLSADVLAELNEYLDERCGELAEEERAARSFDDVRDESLKY